MRELAPGEIGLHAKAAVPTPRAGPGPGTPRKPTTPTKDAA
jgi:hypothetical protein